MLFKNLKTGLLEKVINKELIEQYLKYPENYQLIENKKELSNSTSTEQNSKDGK